jgi:hypothetical protein
MGQFSGFVDYTSQFESDPSSEEAVLSLGKANYMAEVWVNGQHVGARLWPPYEFAIGHMLRGGTNEVRVRVGNLLLNAVTQFPNKEWLLRHTQNREEYLESGLFGPVVVKRKTRWDRPESPPKGQARP